MLYNVDVYTLNVMYVTVNHTRYDPGNSSTSITGGGVECNYRNMGDMYCNETYDTICVSRVCVFKPCN